MTLGSICHNSPAGQERWWVLLDGHMLHLELVASVFGVAHALGLWFEDVDLEEVAGCQLLKPGLILSLLHFAPIHQNSAFISLVDSYCNYVDNMAYRNHRRNDTRWQEELAIGSIEFKLLTIVTLNQIPLRYTSDFPILPHREVLCNLL